MSTAKTLIFHHPDLITKDRELAGIIYSYMDDNRIISDMFQALGRQMRQMGQPTETSGWARLVPYTPPQNDDTGYDGTTTYYSHQPTPEFMDAAGPAATAMMKATKNERALQGKKWQQQTGVSVESSSGQAHLELAARLESTGGEAWNAALTNTGAVDGLQTQIDIVDSAKTQVKLTLRNTYIRYLGAYIRFYDASGNAMPVPTWRTDDNTVANIINDVLDIQYPDLRFIGHIQPVDNVFAIPIVADPGKLEVTVTFPERATSASVYGAGLGTGTNSWPKTPIVGGVMTGLFNLAVPAFMLAFQVAAQSYKPLYDLIESLSSNRAFIGVVVGGGITYFGEEFGRSAAHREMNWHAFSTLFQLLFNQAATRVLLWVETVTAGEKAAEEIPFAGWIMIAINIATGLAQMAETIVEVATSPWNIENKIATSITTSVTLYPDPRHQVFPRPPANPQASYTVKMIYKDQTRPTVSHTHDVPADSTASTLPDSFPHNTLGGQVKFEADYYLAIGWPARRPRAGWTTTKPMWHRCHCIWWNTPGR